MRLLDIKNLSNNFIDKISKDWMLVTSGTPEKFNTMTASWGGIGYLWNKPVAFIFIRPERYTSEFIGQNNTLTLCFLQPGNRKIYNLCGSKSGRDIDKVKASGLRPLLTHQGSITFEQARLTIECRKLYSQPLSAEGFLDQGLIEKWYGEKNGGFHQLYILEIISLWGK